MFSHLESFKNNLEKFFMDEKKRKLHHIKAFVKHKNLHFAENFIKVL